MDVGESNTRARTRRKTRAAHPHVYSHCAHAYARDRAAQQRVVVVVFFFEHVLVRGIVATLRHAAQKETSETGTTLEREKLNEDSPLRFNIYPR